MTLNPDLPAAATEAADPAGFPGEAKLGMKGPIVVAWQEALILHGIIADNEDNHDGDYGEGMEKAVLRLQRSWGWSDADGIAGTGTWRRLQSDGEHEAPADPSPSTATPPPSGADFEY